MVAVTSPTPLVARWARPGRQCVEPRDIALGPAAGAGVEDCLRDQIRGGDEPPCLRAGEQLRGRESLGLDEPRQNQSDVDTMLALFPIQRIAPSGESELAGRIRAGVGPRHPRRGARDVDDGY